MSDRRINTAARSFHYTASPSEGSGVRPWVVWDTYKGLPPQVVFTGTMEEAGGVADALNERAIREGGHP